MGTGIPSYIPVHVWELSGLEEGTHVKILGRIVDWEEDRAGNVLCYVLGSAPTRLPVRVLLRGPTREDGIPIRGQWCFFFASLLHRCPEPSLLCKVARVAVNVDGHEYEASVDSRRILSSWSVPS
ncbi:unnamed protein product [Darwinula stevensoni]|uniref:Uncharacterized protein n=1 Tax=Darwinula stevensoni TaxID=69355 RepID=A0A7R9AEG9_9CRUS|nr:unnamed protein product [Darwinula stevensoni]CAG0902390.1 unnamed protein product [Darwinula stevensoni]